MTRSAAQATIARMTLSALLLFAIAIGCKMPG